MTPPIWDHAMCGVWTGDLSQGHQAGRSILPLDHPCCLDAAWVVSSVTKTMRGVSYPLISFCRSECSTFTKKRPLRFVPQRTRVIWASDRNFTATPLSDVIWKARWFSNYYFKIWTKFEQKAPKNSWCKLFGALKFVWEAYFGHEFCTLILVVEGCQNRGAEIAVVFIAYDKISFIWNFHNFADFSRGWISPYFLTKPPRNHFP